MLHDVVRLALIASAAAAGGVSQAHAQVGDPFGTFEITIEQSGSGLFIQDTVTIGLGEDLFDLRPTFADADPEDFTQIGSTLTGEEPVILKVVSDFSSDEPFRITHWYIDVPESLLDIRSPGPTSLFDPLGGNIDVTITGLEFSNGAEVIPLLLDSPNFYTSFMRDVQGHFYEFDDAHGFDAFGNGFLDIQVPGSVYLDSDPSLYQFEVLETGSSASWAWNNIVNPGLNTPVNDGLGTTLTPLEPGYVFELGLAVAFVTVPEPGTWVMLTLGTIPLMAWRKRRRSF